MKKIRAILCDYQNEKDPRNEKEWVLENEK